MQRNEATEMKAEWLILSIVFSEFETIKALMHWYKRRIDDVSVRKRKV